MKILVLPGDGIGPEITHATLQVLGALPVDLEFETRDIGLASLKNQGTTLPSEVLDRIPEVDGVILGPVSHYEYPAREKGGINPSGAAARAVSSCTQTFGRADPARHSASCASPWIS